MSDISDGFVPSDADGGAPVGIASDDTPTDVSSSTEAESQAVAEALDIAQYGNHMVPIKIDGEERQVPLSEALNGYQRQEVFTRKTQELAEQKQRLARAEAITAALEVDPAATLQALSEAYGQSLQPASQDNQEELDPQEARLRQMESQYQSWQETQRQAQIEKELTALKDEYGDFDETALLTHAIQKGIGDLGAAYRDMTYSDVWSKAQAREAAAQKSAEEDAQITDAKREAGIVQGGAGRQAGSVGAGPQQVNSVHEAYLAAKQVLGI